MYKGKQLNFNNGQGNILIFYIYNRKERENFKYMIMWYNSNFNTSNVV